jgi:dienelactone hydrolase
VTLTHGLSSGLVFVGLSLIITGCGGGSSTPPPPISVSINPIAQGGVLQAGGTLNLTAEVTNDSSNQGVTWSVSCAVSPCGNVSPTSTASGVPTVYTAPATPPVAAENITIVATSVADPTKLASITVNFGSDITVLLSASVSPVMAGTTSLISAAVNDAANKGVDPNSWTISPASGAGTLSSPTSTSVIYNAPATPPADDVQITITATSLSDATKSGNVVIVLAAIAISLSSDSDSLPAQGTATITAAVSFDPANAGVDPKSWTIASPTSGGGSLSGATATSVTYTAPSTPPISDLPITITAVASSDPTRLGSTSITVLAIRITISPRSALIPVGSGSLQFTAVVQNDPSADPQVTWTTLQADNPCPSGCDSVSSSTTSSGTPTTYTPPSTLPANAAVTLVATSSTDTTKSAPAAITLTNGSVQIVPASLAFGNLKTNHFVARTITLTNTGPTALTINSIGISGSRFSLTANTCGSSVAPATSCQLTVTFGSGTAGNFFAVLSINDSSTDSPQEVPMTATARSYGFYENEAALNLALSTNKAPSTPAPTGSSPVGTRLLDLLDSTRNDPFLANGTKRELLVRLWYPAAIVSNCPRAEYTSALVWNDFSRLVQVALPRVTTNSCWNAPVAEGFHPVVIFTHGYTGTFTDYTYLFEDLASRGYVVASVDHTFEATAVEFPDGRFAESVFGSHLGTSVRGDESAMAFAVSVRLGDLAFVVDELERRNTGTDAQLAGRLDMTRLALAGHSLGGLTTILAIEKDPRYRAAVVLDGVVPKTPIRDSETPMLLLANGRDTWTDEERQLWNSRRGPRLAVNLLGTEHATPSDLIWLAAGAVKTGSMGPEKTIAAIRNYVADFLDTSLLDRPPTPLITGSSPKYRDAVVTTRNQSLRAKE